MFKPGHYYIVYTGGAKPLGPFQTIPAATQAHEAKPRDAMVVQAIMHLPGAQAADKASVPAAAAIGQNAG